MRDDRTRLADGERVIDFRRRITIIERRGDETGALAGEIMSEQKGAVRH
jgi:hypothetical protein